MKLFHIELSDWKLWRSTKCIMFVNLLVGIVLAITLGKSKDKPRRTFGTNDWSSFEHYQTGEQYEISYAQRAETLNVSLVHVNGKRLVVSWDGNSIALSSGVNDSQNWVQDRGGSGTWLYVPGSVSMGGPPPGYLRIEAGGGTSKLTGRVKVE
jgi:hypothetical protein